MDISNQCVKSSETMEPRHADMTCSCEYAPYSSVSPIYHPPIRRRPWPYYYSSSSYSDAVPNSNWTSSRLLESKTRVLESSVLIDEPTHTHIHTHVEQSLVYKLMGDVGISAIVALGAAPWISVIDKAVVERSTGRRTIFQSCTETLRTMVRDPVTYLKSPMFLIMWGCYASTYATGVFSFGILSLFVPYSR